MQGPEVSSCHRCISTLSLSDQDAIEKLNSRNNFIDAFGGIEGTSSANVNSADKCFEKGHLSKSLIIGVFLGLLVNMLML
jgi:hypothetical protein